MRILNLMMVLGGFLFSSVTYGQVTKPVQDNSISVVLPIDVVIEGNYHATGVNPDGGRYEAVVAVSKSGQTYKVAWAVGDQQYVGTGILQGDAFAVVWVGGNDLPPGLIVYKVNADRTFEGTYAYFGGTQLAFETWRPRKR